MPIVTTQFNNICATGHQISVWLLFRLERTDLLRIDLFNCNDIIFIRGVAAGRSTSMAGARQQPTLVTNEQVCVFIVKEVSKIFALFRAG